MTHHTSQQAHGVGSPIPEVHAATESGSVSPQESLSPILPLHREFLAHFTGQWPEGYRPRWRRRPGWHLLTMLLTLVGGVAASIVLLRNSPACWPLLGLSWMLTVHGARKAQLVIIHHAVHANLTGHPEYDQVVAEALSTLLLLQPFDSYRRDHVTLHHGRCLATLADPDVRLLLLLGFRPGMSRQALWRHLYRTLVSPRFHMRLGWMRLRANFLIAPGYRRLMAGGYAVAGVTSLALTGAWFTWLVAWVIPLWPLYHVAALLQFVSEHTWLQVYQPTTTHEAQERNNGSRPLTRQ
jgi:hypothetical protein